LAKGEVLGVAGLQGMGQHDLFLGCFGAAAVSGGTILVNGNDVRFASPRDAIESGIGLVPEDRKTEGLFLGLNGTHNASLPSLARVSRLGFINSRAERARVGTVFETVQLALRALYDKVSTFSGGNQQKIAIAKWMLSGSQILLLFDPTRGVDVGTKHEIYVMIREFAARGGSVLFFTSEIPELVNLCDRVLVVYGKRLVGELGSDDLNEESIMQLALGGNVAHAKEAAA
jgi:ribose transport system ATP-binding protein